jgi:hypothetical protein
MTARIVKPRVYLEGIEIPAYRVTIQSAIGGPASAVIDIPPLEEFFERVDEEPPKSGKFVQKSGVLPRSFVHVFYEDNEDPDDQLRLLFEGEFVRFEYAKTVESRTLRLVARDLSNIFSSVYVRYYSDFVSPYSNLVSALSGVGTVQQPDPTSIKMSLVGGPGLNPEILKAVTEDKDGFGIASAFRQIALDALKTNAFFGDFDDRTKVSKKVATLVDIKSKLLLNTKLLEGLILQNMSNLKESASLWDIYSMLMSLVFYFPCPVTSAPYIAKKIAETGDASKGSKQFTVLGDKSIASLILKPYTWWTAPPNFNVIFPDQYKTFTLGRDFLTEPTRIMMSAFGIIETLLTQGESNFRPSQFIFIAPKSLADRFDKDAFDSQFKRASETIAGTEDEVRKLTSQRNELDKQSKVTTISASEKSSLNEQIAKKNSEISEQQQKIASLNSQRKTSTGLRPASDTPPKPKEVDLKKFNRSVMGPDDNVSLASREDIKGIIFGFDYMQQTQVEVTKSKGISADALKGYLANVASYKLALQQYKGRFATMSMVFSPQLVAGFPALVVDPLRNFFGEIETITHVIDANGVADTQIQLSFVRGDEVEFGEASRNTTGDIQFPRWLNDSYLPKNIDKAVYKKLFPENKPIKGKKGVPAAKAITPAYGENQVLAAREIRRLFFASRDRQRFAASFTRRNIATVDQVMTTILGAPKVGRNYIVGGTQTDRFKAAMEYASKTSMGSVLVRSENPEPSARQMAPPSAASSVRTATAARAASASPSNQVNPNSRPTDAELEVVVSLDETESVETQSVPSLETSVQSSQLVNTETTLRQTAKTLLSMASIQAVVAMPGISKQESYSVERNPQDKAVVFFRHRSGGIQLYMATMLSVTGKIVAGLTLSANGSTERARLAEVGGGSAEGKKNSDPPKDADYDPIAAKLASDLINKVRGKKEFTGVAVK